MKKCTYCQLKKDSKYFRKGRGDCKKCERLKFKIYYDINHDKLKEKRNIIKIEVFNYYGGPVCNCCEEREITFLSLDHVFNDGAEERRKTVQKAGNNFYGWLKRNNFPTPEKYQILCMNCNFGKAMNSGICPHQNEK